MYPTAYTLTVLVLTLLQYSFDKRFTKNACLNGTLQNENSTEICHQNVMRKEIRQLTRQEFDSFIQVFNEYATKNDTDELNANISELGVVQIFDELLQNKQMLTPYWEYRFELNAKRPETSSLWSAPQLNYVNQANDAQWLIEFIENENDVEKDDFFGDDPFSKLWKRRREALRTMREVKKMDVFWHLLLLVSIETGLDQSEMKISRSACIREYGKFTRWLNETCQVTLRDGEPCTLPGDCYNRRCSKNRCASTKRPANDFKTTESPATTPIIAETITTSSSTTASAPPSTTMLTINEISTTQFILDRQNHSNFNLITNMIKYGLDENVTLLLPLEPTDPAQVDMRIDKNEDIKAIKTPIAMTIQPETRHKFDLKLPPDHLKVNATANNDRTTSQWKPKMAATTEFLANELAATPTTAFEPASQNENKYRRKKIKKSEKKKKTKLMTTTVPPHRQIPPTSSYIFPTHATNTTTEERNNPIEPESYSSDTLDALLVYLPTPKVPTMISWTAKMPLRMVYFSFTVIEGGLGKQRRLKEKGHKRAKGARIYLRGLGMPSGYSQVTQGRQMKTGISALARTLNPNDNEPFVEFKMRVENRYGSNHSMQRCQIDSLGTPCKQMCLDSHERYRRCARRTIRLSPYKKFSDPIPYFESEALATNSQYTGKGYYRKRKLSYLLFKCD